MTPMLTFSAGRPFVIDLESTNKTFVNDEAIPAARYYELKTGDGMFKNFLLKIPLLMNEQL
jgi:smad nuclear-interacting protein 1